MSPQSLFPSHIHRAGIQRPVLAHWNSSVQQVVVVRAAHMPCATQISLSFQNLQSAVPLPSVTETITMRAHTDTLSEQASK